jgi:hypothetical protein
MTLSRTSTWVTLCLTLSTLALRPAGASAPAVADVLSRAAAANDSALAGTVVSVRHLSVSVAAGPAHYAEQNDALVVMEDGAFARVRYLRVVQNGKGLSPDQLAQRDDENNRDLARGSSFFKQPFDRRYLQDYSYGGQVAGPAPNNESEITFRSLIHDDQHGDGTMRIDAASGRVIELTYTPNVLPNRASSGTTTETFGEPIAGLWTIVRIDRSYDGHMAFFRGSGHVIETLDHFRHFNNVEDGLAFVRTFAL